MSCDHNREKFFEIMAATGQADADELERTFQGNRRVPGTDAERLSAEAKTRLLFDAISAQSLKPPTHSPSGLPRADAQSGYAAVYDLLRQCALIGDGSASLHLAQRRQRTAPALPPIDPATLGPDGRNPAGFDRWGYNKAGFDRRGRDRQGYDQNGLDQEGYNRLGFDDKGYDRSGFNAAGYNRQGIGRDDLTFDGFHPNTGLDPNGFDKDGYGTDGYDREGYDRNGLDRSGNSDPNFSPDAQGFYPDGLDAHGFGRDGYDAEGYDRYGFGRDGYNRGGIDRNGYDRSGRIVRIDPEGYDRDGYKSGSPTWRKFDRAGFDSDGFDANHRSVTGFDTHGLDSNGNPRMTLNTKGKVVPVKFRKDGFDDQGYDRWGFHKDTGLTAPDGQGRRLNMIGWVYDEKSNECYDPADPSRRMKHRFSAQKTYLYGRHGGVVKVRCQTYIPPAPPPPVTPFAPMAETDYAKSTNMFDYSPTLREKYLSYDKIQNRAPTTNDRRRMADPQASKNGIRLRCPHCGQYTGGASHICPAFGDQQVTVYHSGMVSLRGLTPHAEVLASPLDPDFDPRFDMGKKAGYDEQTGRDRDGFDKQGYNERGFDREGYSPDGFDIFGYNRDGYDRHGYNNAGVNRRGEQRGRSLTGVTPLMDDEDLLGNQDLARLYSQIATGLVGKPRRVVFREGEGFATDMKGTIYADPYPLGRRADPRHNLVVTRAGIYHELGHEQFTPTQIWERVLAVHQGQQAEDSLGQAGSAMLPRFYNIVEDGRMERQVAANYAGAAEILAASCRLEPRWGEQVGTSVPPDQEVFWALLYTGLPYYRVRPEVREAMSPRARALFEELEPVVSRAVHGSPEDAYRCAVHLARRFEEEGLIQLPPQEQDYSRALPGGSGGSGQPDSGNGRQPGAAEDQSGQQTSSQSGDDDSAGGVGRKVATGDEPQKGPGRGTSLDDQHTDRPRAAAGEEPAAGDQGAGKKDQPAAEALQSGANQEDDAQGSSEINDADEWLFGDQAVDAAVAAVERDAAAAIEGGLRARSRASTIGKPLHRPLPEESSMSQRYRGADGMPASADVYLPRETTPHPELDARRERHRQVASLMAKPLRAIREQAEQRLRRLPEGRLDRRQLVNAVKGLDDVYTATKERPRTSFAASIAVDMSGSMGGHIQSMELYDSVMVLGDTFELLDMPHEVRAFGSSSAQVKAMDEPFATQRAAYLASGDLGGTVFNDTAGLAQSSLLAREETNRMMICLSDGAFSDHEESVRSLRQARQNGIVTFGIFLGPGGDPDRLNELYGKGNWTSIQTLSDMPKAVAQRLASIFKSMR